MNPLSSFLPFEKLRINRLSAEQEPSDFALPSWLDAQPKDAGPPRGCHPGEGRGGATSEMISD